jgi:D-alanyl-D-alanine carboxypeptidase
VFYGSQPRSGALSKASGFSKSKKNSGSGDDIPEALRDVPNPTVLVSSNDKRFSAWGLWIGISVVIIGATLSGLWWVQQNARRVEPGTTAMSATSTAPSGKPPADQLLGHYAYTVAPLTRLEAITPGSPLKLQKAAAAAFREMADAARTDGVILLPLSGFRSIEDQNYLFFKVKADRAQSATKRAEVSAPPGYSEHHTGYAIDIGDANIPALNLNPDFEKTAAYQWLEANAARFSFELSFPRNNPQGVSYEPWHWRYVGDRDSLETFYKARGTAPQP